MKPKIHIVTGPIQTGKTTRLMSWLNTRDSVDGFLTPDVDGKRMLYDIHTKKMLPFETHLNDTNSKELVIIGPFRFLSSGFEQAKTIFRRIRINNPEWVIIDEVGKLELKNKGLEPELSVLIDNYKTEKLTGNLLLVIRDTLLEPVLEKYEIQDLVEELNLDQ